MERRGFLWLGFIVVAASIVMFFWFRQGSESNVNNVNTQPVYRECVSDADCTTAGCSGQICTTTDRASGMVTTCEFREEYQCLNRTSCLCISGFCRFEQNDLYQACLDDLKN